MDIRTFEAFTMKDAVRSVKRTLGADAVILSTRQRPAPGGKGTLYEVTAAANHGERAAGASADASSAPRSSSPEANAQLESVAARITALAEQTPSRRQVDTLTTGLAELKLLLVETLRTQNGSVIKDLAPPLVPLDRQLRVMGLDDGYIAELMRHLRNLPEPAATGDESDPTGAYYRDHALRFMMKRIKIAPRWNVMPGAQTTQVLVGPAGAGKSSLVAKLAAHYHVKEQAKTLVVSLDNQRLAAAEQMRVFCKVLGVPFAAVTDIEDLPRLVIDNKDAELILVDTAGLSIRSGAGLSALSRLKELFPVDFHLCLAVTEKETQLEQAVKAFAPLGLASLAFTKLDDCWSYGEIYNLSKRWGIPLSFFSTGQEIPDDLERATRERVVERIFGL